MSHPPCSLGSIRKGSNNRRNAAAKVARAHRKVAAARADLLHRTSTALVRNHDLLVAEDRARHDRDLNDAMNILAAGRAVAAACGADVSHSGVPGCGRR
jgi:hypothetical protein